MTCFVANTTANSGPVSFPFKRQDSCENLQCVLSSLTSLLFQTTTEQILPTGRSTNVLELLQKLVPQLQRYRYKQYQRQPLQPSLCQQHALHLTSGPTLVQSSRRLFSISHFCFAFSPYSPKHNSDFSPYLPNKTYSVLFAQAKQWGSAVSLLVLTWVLFFSPSGPVLRVYVLIKQSNTRSPISIFIANFCFASSFAITILFICCSVVWLIDLLSNSYHLSFVFQFGEHCLLFDPCLLFHCLLIWPQFTPAPQLRPPMLRINSANDWLRLTKRRIVYKRRWTLCANKVPRPRPLGPSRTAYDHPGRGVWPWAED